MQCLQTHSLTQSLNLFLMANDMGSAPSPATARANMKRRVLFIFGYSILSTSLRTSASRFGETRMEVLHDLIFLVSKTHHSCSRTHDINDKTSFKKTIAAKDPSGLVTSAFIETISLMVLDKSFPCRWSGVFVFWAFLNALWKCFFFVELIILIHLLIM